MHNTTDSEKFDPYTDEEPCGEYLYTDGVILEKANFEDVQAVPEDKPPRRVGHLELLLFSAVALFVTLTISHVFVARRGFAEPPANAGPEKSPLGLNLISFYPDITSPPGSACRTAWNTLVSVPCSNWVLNHDSDNGTMRPGVWDPMAMIHAICDPICHSSLVAALDRLAASCTPSDEFILDNDSEGFDNEALGSGPAAAVATLLHRKEHSCRASPESDSDYEYCAIEMWERFHVMDGASGNTQGLKSFLVSTRYRRTEPGSPLQGTQQLSPPHDTVDHAAREQQYGPGHGETSCGFCVFDFLNHTLNSWTEDSTVDPDNGLSVSLVDFIRRVRVAGDRCAPTRPWTEIYNRAVSRYFGKGLLLPSDLGDLDGSQSPHDLDYLMRNGPSEHDAPVSALRAKIERLSARNNFTNPFSSNGTINEAWSLEDIHTGACLHNLGRNYLAIPCYITLSQEQFSQMLNELQTESNLRSAYCRQECSYALSTMTIPHCEAPTTDAQADVSTYLTARERRKQFCKLTTPAFETDNCAKALVDMHKTEWVTNKIPISAVPFAEIDEELQKLKDRALKTEQLSLGAVRAQKPLQGNVQGVKAQWKDELGASICAGCFWNWAAGTTHEQTFINMLTAPSREEYVDFLKRYLAVCQSLGADWLGGTPYGDDPVIWRVREANGDVMRYMESAEGPGSQPGGIYSVREANGRLRLEPMMTPGQVTLWHVMRLEREVKATSEGRWADWYDEEKARRAEADAETFGSDPTFRVRHLQQEKGDEAQYGTG